MLMSTVKKVQVKKLEPFTLMASQEVEKIPSPLMGEGRGEGEYSVISITYVPSP
jgi:hypothetical protein